MTDAWLERMRARNGAASTVSSFAQPKPQQEIDTDLDADIVPEVEPSLMREEELPKRDFWDVLTGFDFVERAPVLGSGADIKEIGGLLAAARRVEAGRGSAKDERVLHEWAQEQQRGMTIPAQVLDLVLDIPKFVGEIAISGGTVSAGKAAAKKTAKWALSGKLAQEIAEKNAKKFTNSAVQKWATRMAKSRAGKVAGWSADVGARVVGLELVGQVVNGAIDESAGGGIVTASAAQKAIEGVEWYKDEFGRFRVMLDSEIPDMIDKMPAGYIDGMIQIGSELAGGPVVRALTPGMNKVKEAAKAAGVKLPLYAQLKAIQLKTVDRWLKQDGKRRVQDFMKVLETRGGFNGVLGEFLEERLAGVGELGAEMVGFEDDFDGLSSIFPGWERAAVELMAFSVPGAVAAGGVAISENRKRKAIENLDFLSRLQMTAEESVLKDDAFLKTDDGRQYLEALRAVTDRVVTKKIKPEDLQIQTQSPSFMQGEGKRLESEIQEFGSWSTLLGGNAYRDRTQERVANGIFGTTVDIVGDAINGDPVTYQMIFDLAVESMETANPDFQPQLARGRTSPKLREKPPEGEEGEQAFGEDLMRSQQERLPTTEMEKLRARVSRANDLGEMTERFAALFSASLWRFKKRTSGYGYVYLRDNGVWGQNGAARADRGVVREFIALQSLVEPLDGMRPDVKEKDLMAEGIRRGMAQRGFEHFMRLWLTADGQSAMPKATEWFEETFAANHPEMFNKLLEVRDHITRYRFQGTSKRAWGQHKDTNAWLPKAKAWIAKMQTRMGRDEFLRYVEHHWTTQNAGLKPISKAMQVGWARRTAGGKLPASKTPFLVAESRESTARSVADTIAWDGGMDWDRNDTGVRPLSHIRPLVRGRLKDFSLYLFARRVAALQRDMPAYLMEDGSISWGAPLSSRKKVNTSDPRMAGLSKEDAVVLIAQLEAAYPGAEGADRSAFAEAAVIVYEWYNGVLDFVASANKSMEELVKRMRLRDPGDFVSLHRILENMEEISNSLPNRYSTAMAAELSEALEGSGEAVEEVFRVLVSKSEEIIQVALDSNLMEVIFSARDLPETAPYFNVLQPDEVAAATEATGSVLVKIQEAMDQWVFNKAAKYDREEMGRRPVLSVPDGASGSNIVDLVRQIMEWNMREMLVAGVGDPNLAPREQVDKLVQDFFQEQLVFTGIATQPRSDGRLIWPRMLPSGGWEWIEVVDPSLMRFLNAGIGTAEEVRLAWKLMAWHKKAFTLGTTGLRLVFQFFRNPVRDFGTAIINTRSHAPVLTVMIPTWFKAMYWETIRAFKGERHLNEFQKLYLRLGQEWGNELRVDSFRGRRNAERLSGKTNHFVDFWDYAMGLLQIPERTTRTMELELLVKEMQNAGTIPKGDELVLNADQVVELSLAAKQVSTHFAAGGETARKWNQITPFFNAAIQGPRDTIRAIFNYGPEERNRKLARAAKYYTTMGVAAWLLVRDEPWYAELSVEQKANTWYIPIPGTNQVAMVPMPFELGIAFSAIPVAFLDAYYREDPEGVNSLLGDLGRGIRDSFATMRTATPPILPPSFRLPLEVTSNHNFFFQQPIVNNSLQRLQDKAQYDEYTSNFAKWLGKTAERFGAEEGWSPKMIDYITSGIFGRGGLDFMRDVSGTDARERDGVFEWPFIREQTMEKNAYPKSVDQAYKAYNRRLRAFDTGLEDESSHDREVRLLMRDGIGAMSAIGVILRMTDGAELRAELQAQRLGIAKEMLEADRTGYVSAEQRAAMKATSKTRRAEKAKIREAEREQRREDLR